MSVLHEFVSAAKIIAQLEVYIVDQPREWPEPENSQAYSIGPWCDCRMRDWLIAKGLWTGWKPMICFVRGASESLEDKGLFLHEAAHLLPALRHRADLPPSDFERSVHETRFKQKCEYVAPVEPWQCHEWQFIRRALHLVHRASNCLHWPIAPRDLQVCGKRYGLSRIEHYLAALGDEPHELRNTSFQEIETLPPPTAFADLFASDVEKWHKQEKYNGYDASAAYAAARATHHTELAPAAAG